MQGDLMKRDKSSHVQARGGSRRPRLPAAALMVVAMIVCAEPVQARVIHMVIEADETMNAFEVKRKFETAVKSTDGFNYESVEVDPIASESYALLDSLVRRGLLETEKVAVSEGGVLLEPVAGEVGAWRLDLGDVGMFLDSASIRVKVPGEEERVEELGAPSPRGQVGAKLRFFSPGVYLLSLGEDVSPRSAILRVSDNQGVASEVTVGWPRVGRCYLVTLIGVVGNEANLFASLQDKRKVGDPIKQLFPSTSTLIVGSFREKDPWLRPGYISLRYPMPAGRAPARLWLRFPLTQQQTEAVCNELDQRLLPADGFTQLPVWLTSKRLPDGEKLEQGDDYWVEVPFDAGENAFVIDVPIDTQGWKAALAAKPASIGDRVVLAWEWEDPANQESKEILRVGGPGGKRYQVDQVGWWLQGLPTAPEPQR